MLTLISTFMAFVVIFTTLAAYFVLLAAFFETTDILMIKFIAIPFLGLVGVGFTWVSVLVFIDLMGKLLTI